MDRRLVDTYTENINDLQHEKQYSIQLRKSMSSVLMFENENNVPSNTDEEVTASASMSVVTDDDLHREVRRR